MKPPRPVYAYLSAAALAFVTLATFYVFQDYGPQSVIRQFHNDVATGNYRDLDRITIEGFNSPSTQYLVSSVQAHFLQRASYEIVAMKRSSRSTVQAVVQYVTPAGFGSAEQWIVRQQNGEWKVDCAAFRRFGL